MAKAQKSSDTCPMSLGINVLSGKWKLQILSLIHAKKVVRFNELKRNLGRITTKTLTDQLRELEVQGVVQRAVYAQVPPKVEYSLSPIGAQLEKVLKELCEWGKEYQKTLCDG
ncbi:winged helix-turn-helix transcriptional regulator [Campylobacter curvus]|uniref:winged helix-turn-helix transcriptional regulator n=1 Tax=Campylobacter curvus TaxID=200 RepID=UPI0014706EE1|nr:helix-turn-helix domain-containing protein [Campylobacter curvus]